VLKAQSRGSCEIVNAQPSAEIPMVPIANGPYEMYAAGLEVSLNGKKRRFELDTGASGLLLSRSVAQAAGLVSEAEGQGGGIGDQGPRKELLAHVDDIKIGNLEFHNCLVRIFDKKDVLQVDGLIGADVFSSYLVTLDIPGQVVRLAPLPKRPDETASSTASLDTSGADVEAESTPRNRYIPPEWEKENWTKVFRSGHLLVFPTNINNGPTRLFVMDTGASNEGLVSIEAAKEVTGVGGSNYAMKGVSGYVNDVKSADNITIAFGGVREQLHNVPAIDLSSFTRGAGTEISGFIGFFTLRELVITIDYRDSLVRIVYDPKHGFHRH
jgi:predicted aspartyl protease